MLNATTITFEELSALYASANDSQGHHLLWVDRDGGVHLDLVPEGTTPAGYQRSLGERMEFCFAPMTKGNGLVGVKAASDEKYMQEQYKKLVDAWKNERRMQIEG